MCNIYRNKSEAKEKTIQEKVTEDINQHNTKK